MPTAACLVDTAVVTKVRSALRDMYGTSIDRAVLFGSRARGTAHEGSDYDVALFLHDLTDRWAELDRLADLRVRFIDDTGAFVAIMPYPSSAYEQRTPLMREIRLDGIDL